MTNPNPAYAPESLGHAFDPADDFDAKDWIMRNIHLNDPVELRRDELRGWAEATGFTDVDVRNLGEVDFWEMRFNRGTNKECETAADAERWMRYIAHGCRCRIEPEHIVVIVDADQIAARFRLRPVGPPEQAG